MMLGHTTFERQFQFRDLVPQFPLGHLCQPGSVLLPSEHRLQDRSPRSTQSIGRYRCQLDVGILQHFLNAIRNPVDLLYQTHAIAREVSKFTCWLRGHETPAQVLVNQYDWLPGPLTFRQAVLFHVPALSLSILAGATCVMALVSLFACLLPSQRAARISPMEALTEE